MSAPRVQPGGPLRGRLRVPGDKSISHRALIFNAIARGEARVSGLLEGEDVMSTLTCLRQLGAQIEREGASWRIRGAEGRLQEPAEVLDCGNSGTTMRLLCGLLAGQPFFSALTGDATLRRRPMGRVAEPLRRLGAQIDGRQGGRLAPLSIRGGRLRNQALRVEVASAQVKTALLLAGLGGEGELLIEIPDCRDHTERMWAAMGLETREQGRLRLAGPAQLEAVSLRVPGDISSAAFLMVAAAICPGSDLIIEGVGLNPSRTGVISALRRMGAEIELLDLRLEAGEEQGSLRVRGGALRGVEIGGEEIPTLIDELPILALAAALAEGETRVSGAEELRVKESDRVASTVGLLQALGGAAEARPDGFVIEGRPRLRGARVHSGGDHRISLCAAVAGLVAEGGVEVEGWCAEVSFPGFLGLLEGARSAG